MAEPTPTDIYDSFCTERDSLEATIATLEAAPALDTLDTLSAAKTRLAQVQAALPDICQARDAYEGEQRMLALLAVQAPRWSDAAAAKVSALDDVRTQFLALLDSVQAYRAAHGVQTSVLIALHYSRDFRALQSRAPDSLNTILDVCMRGDQSWLARLTTFDPVGCAADLPTE